QGHELVAKHAEPVDLDCRAIMDANVMALDPAKILEGLAEYCNAARNLRIGFRQSYQYADIAEPPDGLRDYPRRPRRHGAGQQRKYLAASHAITSLWPPGSTRAPCLSARAALSCRKAILPAADSTANHPDVLASDP